MLNYYNTISPSLNPSLLLQNISTPGCDTIQQIKVGKKRPSKFDISTLNEANYWFCSKTCGHPHRAEG